jgi:flagellar protein FliO/FliZ
MVPKHKIYLIGLLFLLALDGFDSHVFAEQVNQSVKDCIGKPETCGEQVSPQKEAVDKETEAVDRSSSTSVSEGNSTVGITAWDFIKMILATIFVVALLYFVLKFVNKKSSMFKKTQVIENLGGVPLGSNRSVQIIKIGNRLFIVGVGENVQLLKEIEDYEDYKEILSNYNNQLDQMIQPNEFFGKLMDKVSKRKKNSKGVSTVAPPFQSMLQQQLDELAKERKKAYEEVAKSEGTDKQ